MRYYNLVDKLATYKKGAFVVSKIILKVHSDNRGNYYCTRRVEHGTKAKEEEKNVVFSLEIKEGETHEQFESRAKEEARRRGIKFIANLDD